MYTPIMIYFIKLVKNILTKDRKTVYPSKKVGIVKTTPTLSSKKTAQYVFEGGTANV